VAGLNSAIWGTYKDCLYEEFKVGKFARSLIIGLVLGVLLFLFLKVNNIDANLGVFFAFVVVFERFAVEAYKLFLREEDQSKYFIPQKLHILGKIVEKRTTRYASGIVLVLLALALFYMPFIVRFNFESAILTGFLWGAIGGFFISIGGALKDAPMEGFEPIKFWRSAFIAGMWGMIFSFFTNNYSLLVFASIGAERMTVELYKTFIVGRAHSKLKAARGGKPLFPEWDDKRKKFIIPYIATWIVFAALLLFG